MVTLNTTLHCLHYYPEQCSEGYHVAYHLMAGHIKHLAATCEVEGYGLWGQLAHACHRYDLDVVRYMRCFNHLRSQAFEPKAIDVDGYCAAVADMASFIATTIGEALPEAFVPHFTSAVEARQDSRVTVTEKCRVVVSSWSEQCLYGHLIDSGEALPCEVALPAEDTTFADLSQQLYPGAQLNLLHTTTDERGVIHARYVVLEPDFLVDISALSASIKPYGTHPLNYLLKRFEPHTNTLPILMGSVANQFMDDCIHEGSAVPADTLYTSSLHKVFRQYPISFTCSPEANKIDKTFFDACHTQFEHIYTSVATHFGREDVNLDDMYVEPAFLCEALGIRGRMDVLSADCRTLIELKSGKMDEFQKRMRDEHAIQAALYKAVLYYNYGVPYEECEAYVYYSKYPTLCPIGRNDSWVEQALMARNRIVAMERQMCRGQMEVFFSQLDWQTINEKQDRSRFVEQYLRPSVEAMCNTINTLSPLEQSYFSAFVAFVEREQFYAKIGDNRIGSSRGFAQVWRATDEEKVATGDMLTGLTLVATEGGDTIERLHLQWSRIKDVVPNYDVGDMVMLYRKNEEGATVLNRQVNNAYIEAIDGQHITLRLQYKQRHKEAFVPGQSYVIERSTTDSGFTMMYRNLYAFLHLPQVRKDRFLAQVPPTYDPHKALATDHGDPRINEVVLRAKQANDFFLLIGPPGSGKTSRMLRAMVVEFLADPAHRADNLLLVAYTNQAVSEICEMLATITPAPHYLRLGVETLVSDMPDQHHINQALAQTANRSEVSAVIDGCRIWVSTLHTMTAQADLFNRKHFACAIIDEASQVLEPQFLGLYAAKGADGRPAIDKFVLIGDHKQLPAVVAQSEVESAIAEDNAVLQNIGLTDLRYAVFERLYHNFSAEPEPIHWVDRLTTQGRMHEHIGRFAANEFYEGRLDVACPECQCQSLSYTHCGEGFEAFIAQTRMGFVDVAPQDTGMSLKHNRAEAEAVASIVDHLHRLHQANDLPLEAGAQIGIIVPFRHQISMVRQCLSTLAWSGLDAITIDTVECYQGSQRDFIIFSTTVSTPYQLDILSEDHHGVDRKLNVALTRAKQQQFIVGQANLLRQKPVYARLIDYCDYWCYASSEP